MFWSIKSQIKVSEKIYEQKLLKKSDEDIQIYIAVCQSLFKLDEATISFNLLRYRYPEWDYADEKNIAEVGRSIYLIWREVRHDMENRLSNKFYNLCEKYDTPYLILGDILSDHAAEKVYGIVEEPELLEAEIRTIYKKRLQLLDKKIVRAAVYLTISIFLTKILLLIVLESMIDLIANNHVGLEVLLADLLIPSGLMLLIVSSIKKPSDKNLNLVILETMKIVYQREHQDIYEIKLAKRKNLAPRIISSGAYALLSFATFGIIYGVLHYFNFPITSIIIDIIKPKSPMTETPIAEIFETVQNSSFVGFFKMCQTLLHFSKKDFP